jgi:hypothetical protein
MPWAAACPTKIYQVHGRASGGYPLWTI